MNIVGKKLPQICQRFSLTVFENKMNPDHSATSYILRSIKSENGNSSSSEFEVSVMSSGKESNKNETNSFSPVCIKSEIDSKDFKIIVGDYKEDHFSQDIHAISVHLPCSQCGFMFLNPLYQKQHQEKCKNIDGRSGDRKYTCGACNEEFTEIPDIQQHLQEHSDKSWPICSYCNKVFSRFDYLEVHMKLHNGEKPHCCSICNKTFILSTNHRVHMRTHTREKSYCSICNKTFSHLRIHMRTHTGEKPYCCSICDKSFSVKHDLHKHERIHTGEKPYCCATCNKSFSRFDTLRAHLRIHTGEKPYCCATCNKSFYRFRTLRAHLKIHTGEKPY